MSDARQPHRVINVLMNTKTEEMLKLKSNWQVELNSRSGAPPPQQGVPHPELAHLSKAACEQIVNAGPPAHLTLLSAQASNIPGVVH